MGRSVETVSDATATAYMEFKLDDIECFECQGTGTEPGTAPREGFDCPECRGDGTIPNYDETGEEWRSFLDWVLDESLHLFPSMREDERSLLRPHSETLIIARNAHSAVTVSEYGGMVAISLIPDYDRAAFWGDDNALGEHWRKQVSEKFLAEFSEYRKLGTASNGASFFERIQP